MSQVSGKKILEASNEQTFDEELLHSDSRFKVSTVMDDELDALDELLASESMKGNWEVYHMIGDVLRSDAMSSLPNDSLHSKVQDALQYEPVFIAPQEVTKKQSSHKARTSWMWSGGIAVAASVVFSLFLLNKQESVPEQPPMLQFAADEPMLAPFVSAHRNFVGFSPYRQPLTPDSNS